MIPMMDLFELFREIPLHYRMMGYLTSGTVVSCLAALVSLTRLQAYWPPENVPGWIKAVLLVIPFLVSVVFTGSLLAYIVRAVVENFGKF